MTPPFQPRDPDYETRVRRGFARQSLLATLGATLERVEPGEVEVALAPAPHILQHYGFVHGGAVTTIGDTAAGYAALTLIPAGFGVLTVELKINFLAPAEGDLLRAVGRVVRPGRTLTVVQAEVAALEGGKSRPVALLMATMMAVEDRDGLVD